MTNLLTVILLSQKTTFGIAEKFNLQLTDSICCFPNVFKFRLQCIFLIDKIMCYLKSEARAIHRKTVARRQVAIEKVTQVQLVNQI